MPKIQANGTFQSDKDLLMSGMSPSMVMQNEIIGKTLQKVQKVSQQAAASASSVPGLGENLNIKV